MRKILLILALSGFAFALAAQPNKDVEVTRNYDPTVMDAQKIWYEPTVNADSSNVRDAFSYSIFPKSSPGNFGLAPISSAKIIADDNSLPGLGYIRAGIGYQISPLLDFYISNKNTETVLVGFYANHRSFFGKTKLEGNRYEKKVKSDFMNNDLGIFSKFFLDGSTVTLNADYSRRDLYLYGLDPDIYSGFASPPSSDNDKRAMNLFNGNLLWKSDRDAGEVFYSFGASYQLFNARDKHENMKSATMKENAFALSGLLGADLDDDTQSVSIAARAALYNRNDALDTAGNNILLSALPSWAYNDDYLSVKLGAQYLLDNYNKTTKHRIYPAVSASYKIHDYFTPSIEIKGETEVNNFRKLALENNYISFGNMLEQVGNAIGYAFYANPVFKNTNYKLIGVFSVKGDIESFSYNVFTSYSKLEYLPLYANNVITNFPMLLPSLPIINSRYYYDYKNFYVQYAKGYKVNIGAELSYNDDLFSIYAKAVYNKYNLKNEDNTEIEHAWHKPTIEGNLNLRYKISYDLVLTADFRTLLKRYAANNFFITDNPLALPSLTSRKLKDVFDLSIGAEYLVTNNFSVFGNLANILNQKYEIYSRYKVPGFIASAGLTYRF
ncbi:MAG: hypothetical protein LBC68_04610 [Prevotellaceae bacterium]|jgi:hypothetical protein|nr:hypothetical protein [Prevotellaceae bacterium]